MGGPDHGASISVNESDLNWGDTCTFSYTLPDNPPVKGKVGITLDGYQTDADGNVEYVYGGGGWPIPDPFILKSNYWTEGPAHMVATLYDIDIARNRRRELATTEFDVAA